MKNAAVLPSCILDYSSNLDLGLKTSILRNRERELIKFLIFLTMYATLHNSCSPYCMHLVIFKMSLIYTVTHGNIE